MSTMSKNAGASSTSKGSTAADLIAEHFAFYIAQHGRVADTFKSPVTQELRTNAVPIPVPLLRQLLTEQKPQSGGHLGLAALRSELVLWVDVRDCLPDVDLTVNIMLTEESDEPIWLGYLDDDQWRDIEGVPVDVIAWAPMLKGMA